MNVHVESLSWLLYESTVSTEMIARACRMNSKVISDIRNREFDMMHLELKDAINLSTYAEAIKGGDYYADRRWVVCEDEQIKFYEYEELDRLPQHAELISEVRLTKEIENFEKIKEIRSKVPPDEAKVYIDHRYVEAEEDALRSIGL